MPWTVVAAILSYLAGGIPTAILSGKVLRGIDIREHGSKNAGATNAWRVLGAPIGAAVLLIDAGKGVAAVLLIPEIAARGAFDPAMIQAICGLMAIVGHVWTPFAGFRGGKGVGTAAGVFGALAPWCVAIALLFFVVVVAVTRYISAGSIVGATTLASLIVAQHVMWPETVSLPAAAAMSIVAILVIVKHRANISRLLNGTENRFSFSGKSSVAAAEPEQTP